MVSDQMKAHHPNLLFSSAPLSPMSWSLYQHTLYRQKEQFSDGVGHSWIDGLKAHAERSRHIKEQFSDGVGYSWIDGLKAHAEGMVSDQMLANAPNLFTYLPPKTKEALFYRRIFEKHFPQRSARLTVPGGPSVSCSKAAAVALKILPPPQPPILLPFCYSALLVSLSLELSARLTVPGEPSVA
ncbi:unnamed protein product, partial [Closterium sp. Naga37s-1]